MDNTAPTPPTYREPATVIREWLDHLRTKDPALRIKDREVAELVGVSYDQVKRFRSTDRRHWGGERRRRGEHNS